MADCLPDLLCVLTTCTTLQGNVQYMYYVSGSQPVGRDPQGGRHMLLRGSLDQPTIKMWPNCQII